MDVLTSSHSGIKVWRIIGVVNHENILPGEDGRAGDRDGNRDRERERERER